MAKPSTPTHPEGGQRAGAGEPAAAAAGELTGQQFGSYRVTRLLGRGGMGEVWLGEHPAIGSKVAIKVLHPRYAFDRGVVERFLNEARSVNLIGHENIIKILDFSVTEDRRHYYVMEYLHGFPLGGLMPEGRPLPLEVAGPILLQTCRALQAAHDKGVVHRDLKPENIFLIEQAGRAHFVKVVDFGIAKLLDTDAGPHTQTGTVIGTPAYMSPEQAAGETHAIDARSDIYSLGVVMFQLATGVLPFAPAGRSLRKLILAHLHAEVPSPRLLNPALPPSFEKLILRMLAKAPEDRPRSMREVEAALLECLGDQGASAGLPQAALVESFQPTSGPRTFSLPPPTALPIRGSSDPGEGRLRIAAMPAGRVTEPMVRPQPSTPTPPIGMLDTLEESPEEIDARPSPFAAPLAPLAAAPPIAPPPLLATAPDAALAAPAQTIEEAPAPPPSITAADTPQTTVRTPPRMVSRLPGGERKLVPVLLGLSAAAALALLLFAVHEPDRALPLAPVAAAQLASPPPAPAQPIVNPAPLPAATERAAARTPPAPAPAPPEIARPPAPKKRSARTRPAPAAVAIAKAEPAPPPPAARPADTRPPAPAVALQLLALPPASFELRWQDHLERGETPAQVKVPEGAQVQVVFRLDGYEPSVRDLVATSSAARITQRLQKSR